MAVALEIPESGTLTCESWPATHQVGHIDRKEPESGKVIYPQAQQVVYFFVNAGPSRPGPTPAPCALLSWPRLIGPPPVCVRSCPLFRRLSPCVTRPVLETFRLPYLALLARSRRPPSALIATCSQPTAGMECFFLPGRDAVAYDNFPNPCRTRPLPDGTHSHTLAPPPPRRSWCGVRDAAAKSAAPEDDDKV